MIILAEFNEILQAGNEKAVQHATDWMNILFAQGEETPFPFDANEISKILKSWDMETPLFNKDGIYVCSVPRVRKHFYDNVKSPIPQADVSKEDVWAEDIASEEEQEI